MIEDRKEERVAWIIYAASSSSKLAAQDSIPAQAHLEVSCPHSCPAQLQWRLRTEQTPVLHRTALLSAKPSKTFTSGSWVLVPGTMPCTACI